MKNKVPMNQKDSIGFPIIRTLRKYPEDPDGRILFYDCLTDLADNKGIVRIDMTTLEHYTRATPDKIINTLKKLSKVGDNWISYLICGDTVVIKILRFTPPYKDMALLNQ